MAFACFGVAFVATGWLWVPWDAARGITPATATTVFTPEQIARAEAYAGTSRLLSWTSLAVNLAVLTLLATRGCRTWLIARIPGPWWAQTIVAVVAVTAAVRLATLPFAYALLRHRVVAGTSVQGVGDWLRDVAVSWLVGTSLQAVALVLLVAAIRSLPRVWPVVAGIGAATFVVVGSLAYPVLVEPLFSDFTPLPAGQLRTDLFSMADEQGIELGDVLVSDASARTTTLNAYVSGLGATKRVVLYDTLVEGASHDEVMVVVAHELAHAANHDVWIGTTLGALGAGAGMGLLGVWLGSRRHRGDAALVPVLLLAFAAATLLTDPVNSGVSRALESRADADSLAATQAPDAFVAMHLELALRSLADPTPPRLSQWWWGSHPTVLERIGRTREWE